MSWFTRCSRRPVVQVAVPKIEPLESRAYFTSALLVTVPGPLPASAIAGDKVHDQIKVNVANNGPDKATGMATMTLFASLDQTLDVSDSQIGLPKNVGLGIANGKNKNYRIAVKQYNANLSGNYFIIAEIVGPTITQTSGSSANTVSIRPPTIDVAAGITKVPTKGKIGKKIPVVLNLQNNGNEPDKGVLTINFAVSSDQDGLNPFAIDSIAKKVNIKPGSHLVLHLNVALTPGMPSGNQFIVATVDTSAIGPDINPADNTAVSLQPVSVT